MFQFARSPRVVALLCALVAASTWTTGCQSCDEDVAVNGKQKADGSVNGDGGALGDGGGLDLDADDASSGDGSDEDANGDAANGDTAGPLACTVNADCPSDQLCGLFYNGVKSLFGDPDGKGGVTLPGWADVCVNRPTAGAKEGEACDPFAGDDDATLPACVNQSACMQGLCSALCKTDGDCPKGAACGVTESGISVSNAGAPATAWLPVDICLPMPGDGKACNRDEDCNAGDTCRPFTSRKGAAIVAAGRCVQAEAGKAAAGGACGATAAAKGLGKLCASTLCVYEVPGKTAGVCTATCSSQADCPGTLTWNGVSYPTACSSIRNHHGSDADTSTTEAANDDVYWPHCVLVNQQSSLEDCDSTRSCGGTEACIPYAIAWGPDVAAKVEYRCIQQKTTALPGGPTKDDGAACNPGQGDHGCKGGLCLPGAAAGSGTCSRVCKDDAGCSGGATCKAWTLIGRSDAAKAATAQACQK